MRNETSSKTVIWALASVWFGSHVGGGFASGNQIMQFYSKYGIIGIFMPILSMLLVGWTLREILVFGYNNKVFNYRTWALKAYEPYENILSIIFEFSVMLLFILATSAAIAGGASLLTSFINTPYIVGVLVLGVILLFLSSYGVKLFARANTVMTVVMVLSLLMIMYNGITAKSENLVAAFSGGWINGSLVEIFWSSLKYTGFQAFCGITMLPVLVTVTSINEIKKSIKYGFLINAVMTCLTSALLVGWLTEVQGETLPVLAVLKQQGNGFLITIYSLTLLLAFISTAIGGVFGTVMRFESVVKLNINATAKRMGIALLFMVIAMSISLLGLTNIVKVGYSYVGILSIAIIVLPMITIINRRNRKFLKSNEHSEVA